MATNLLTDGSSVRDAPARVTIDIREESTRWRYGCPHGHTTVEPTNGGVWCRSCSRAADIDDPHHHELLDKQTGETIPWSAVDWVEGPL